MELGNSTVGNSDSVSRAMHILSCLGSGAQYNPFKCQPSSLLQLRARQGFKDRIKMLRPTWTCGMVDDHSVALICSAALFEKLTAGLAAAFEILEDAFTMVLPGALALCIYYLFCIIKLSYFLLCTRYFVECLKKKVYWKIPQISLHNLSA